MALLSVQHTVRDYPAWRTIYDTLGELHWEWGVTAASVHQLIGASNTVLILRHFATVAQAERLIFRASGS